VVLEVGKSVARRLVWLKERIASCQDVTEFKRFRKECSEIGKTQAAKDNSHMRIEAAELRVRCERNAGLLLRGMKLRGGSGKKLQELGISQNESTRWQLVATVDEDVFEDYVSACAVQQKSPSTARLLSLAGKNAMAKREYAPLANHEPSVASSPKKFDLEELRCHRDLLENLIAPVYENASDLLRQEEREHVQRLLHSMDEIIQNLM